MLVMKRSLLALAFMATTALTPVKAHAVPVTLLIGQALFNVSALISPAFGAATLGLITSPFFYPVLGTVLSIGVNQLLNKIFAPDQGNRSRPSDRLINYRQSAYPMETVYGEVRKGGPFGFTGFKNKRRYYSITLASHRTEEVTQHWLDERQVVLDSGGNVIGQLDENGDVEDSPIEGYGNVIFFKGNPAQVADSRFILNFAGFTSAHDFKGVAHTSIIAKRAPAEKFSEVYPRGREWSYSAVIKGHNQIWDPRTKTRGYTNNSALVLADWIVRYLDQKVDWDEVADEANVCDEIVTKKDGSTQVRYTTNVVLSDDESFEAVRSKLALPCDAFLYERTDGKVGFKVGRWIEPEVTLIDQDFYTLELSEGISEVDTPNSVSIIYTDPDNDWREEVSAEYSTTDAQSFRINQRPTIYGVTNHNQASRLNKRLLLTQRADKKISGTLGLMGYELIGQRFIKVEHSGLGINEYFEIDELVRSEQPGSFTFTARSVNPSDFDFAASSEEGIKPSRSNVDNSDAIPEPSNVNATSSGNGTITVTWDNEDPLYYSDVKVCPDGSSTGCQVIQVGEGVETVVVSGLEDGDTYDVQVRHRTLAQRVGSYAPSTPEEITVTNNTTAPASLTTFTATGGSGQTSVSITTANDSNQDSVDLYRGTTTVFGDAVLISNRVLGSNQSETYIDDSLVAGTYYYWGVPKNSSNVEGSSSGPETSTVT